MVMEGPAPLCTAHHSMSGAASNLDLTPPATQRTAGGRQGPVCTGTVLLQEVMAWGAEVPHIALATSTTHTQQQAPNLAGTEVAVPNAALVACTTHMTTAAAVATPALKWGAQRAAYSCS